MAPILARRIPITLPRIKVLRLPNDSEIKCTGVIMNFAGFILSFLLKYLHLSDEMDWEKLDMK